MEANLVAEALRSVLEAPAIDGRLSLEVWFEDGTVQRARATVARGKPLPNGKGVNKKKTRPADGASHDAAHGDGAAAGDASSGGAREAHRPAANAASDCLLQSKPPLLLMVLLGPRPELPA